MNSKIVNRSVLIVGVCIAIVLTFFALKSWEKPQVIPQETVSEASPAAAVLPSATPTTTSVPTPLAVVKTAGTVNTKGWSEYKNTDFGYSLKYPKYIDQAKYPENTVGTSEYPNMNLFVLFVEGGQDTVGTIQVETTNQETAVQNKIKEMNSYPSDYKLKSDEILEFNGYPARKLYFDSEQKSISDESFIFIYKNNKTYVIQIVSYSSRFRSELFDKIDSTASDIFSTFRITD